MFCASYTDKFTWDPLQKYTGFPVRDARPNPQLELWRRIKQQRMLQILKPYISLKSTWNCVCNTFSFCNVTYFLNIQILTFISSEYSENM